MTSPSESDAQHMGILWMLRFDGPPRGGPEPQIPATFARAGQEVVRELAQAMGFADPDPVSQRLLTGRHCYIARIAGKIVAYGWITFDEEDIGELGLRMRLLPGEAYIWDCGTLPAYRGQRLYPALLAHMLAELQRSGVQRIWIGTDADNLPSQSGVVRVGFQPVVDILLTSDARPRRLWSRGRPGVAPDDILDAQYALFGKRDLTCIDRVETNS